MTNQFIAIISGRAEKHGEPEEPVAEPTSTRPNPVEHAVADAGIDPFPHHVREALDSPRNRGWQAVNAAMIESN